MSYGASYDDYLNMDSRVMFHYIEAHIAAEENRQNAEIRLQVRQAAKISQAVWGDKRNFSKLDNIKLQHINIESTSLEAIREERRRRTLESLANLGII